MGIIVLWLTFGKFKITGDVAELVDAADLKSVGLSRAGSSPAIPTNSGEYVVLLSYH